MRQKALSRSARRHATAFARQKRHKSTVPSPVHTQFAQYRLRNLSTTKHIACGDQYDPRRNIGKQRRFFGVTCTPIVIAAGAYERNFLSKSAAAEAIACAQVNRRLSITTHGDRTVPVSSIRQLLRDQHFAIVKNHHAGMRPRRHKSPWPHPQGMYSGKSLTGNTRGVATK